MGLEFLSYTRTTSTPAILSSVVDLMAKRLNNIDEATGELMRIQDQLKSLERDVERIPSRLLSDETEIFLLEPISPKGFS